jgi:hypothetical protein
MSLFALACVIKSLPWKVRHRIKQSGKTQTVQQRGSQNVVRRRPGGTVNRVIPNFFLSPSN